MKERDILWEDGNLWIAKFKDQFVLYKIGVTHSTGFLEFQNLKQAIENGEALLKRPDLVERLIK